MAAKRKNRRLLLQVDFGGSIVNDALIERTRVRIALRTARESGLRSALISNAAKKSPELARAIALVSTEEFRGAYSNGKSSLKNASNGAEAYSDINRTASALLEAVKAKDRALVSGIGYADLTRGIDKRTTGRFFRKFSRPVRAATARSFNRGSFETISRIMKLAKAKGVKLAVDIVSDNNPVLYKKAFKPAIRAEAKAVAEAAGGKGLVLRYRKRPKTVAGRIVRQVTLLLSPKGQSRIYVSGESWGNKNNPESWKRILKDRKLGKNEPVVFVDDSLRKLEGFYRGAKAYGARPVAVWLDLKKENPVDFIGVGAGKGFSYFTIHGIRQLERVMEKEL